MHFRLKNVALHGIASALTVTAASTTSAQIIVDDLEAREAVATDFRNLPANEPAPDSTLPGVKFGDPGVVVFLQSGPFYLEGSNRSWGLIGPDRARIQFSPAVESISIIARGSAEGDMTGPVFGNQTLGEAKGRLFALDALGDRVMQVSLQNVSVRDDSNKLIMLSRDDLKGRLIHGLELVNDGPDNSVVVIAGIGVTAPAIARIVEAKVTNGRLLAGGVADLGAADDRTMLVESGFGQSIFDLHHSETRISARSTVLKPTLLHLSIESAISEPSGTEIVSLLDPASGKAVEVARRSIGLTDRVNRVEGLDAETFVGSDGQIDVVIKHIVFQPFLAFRFNSSFDEVRIELE